MIHEMGGSTAQYSPERVALYDRLQIYSGLAAGPHTIVIRPLHQKSDLAQAFDIDLDGFVVGGR